jgi:hypothetical protein
MHVNQFNSIYYNQPPFGKVITVQGHTNKYRLFRHEIGVEDKVGKSAAEKK